MADELIPLHTLLHRRTDISEEWGASVETSLNRNRVTGIYTLQQVHHGRHETITSSVSLSAGLIAELVPVLTTIANESD